MSDTNSFVNKPVDVNNANKPMDTKETCIAILDRRIKDLKAFERYLKEIKLDFDQKYFAKRIGGLRKCIEVIKNS